MVKKTVVRIVAKTVLLLCLGVAQAGCEYAATTAITGVSMGVAYLYTNVAERTVCCSLDRMGRATVLALGKMGIPDAILMKPGTLTEQERKTVEKHPEIGCQIVGDIDFLKDAMPVIRHHHEHFDGTGYPDGLKGTEIPILARIFTIVDAYDAQTNQRPYNTVLSTQHSLEILRTGRGTAFDPRVVEAFIEMIEEEGDI